MKPPEHGEHQHSVWQTTVEPLECAPLASNADTSVCVVGAGIAGLSVAYEVARAGWPVVVLDDKPIGAGMTGRTTGHLTAMLDDRYMELERLHGTAKMRMAAESHTVAIARFAQIVKDENIECDFERLPGYLFNPPGESLRILEDEFEAAKSAGLPVTMVERAPIDDFDSGPAIRFADQAQFHAVKYLLGLAEAVRRHGGRIFTGSHVTEFHGGPNSYVRTSSGHTVTARHIVVATNTPVNDRFVIHTKQAPYTTYAIGLWYGGGLSERALLWDTAQAAGTGAEQGEAPYHYVRLWRRSQDHEVLIVGGEDHKTGQQTDVESPYHHLEKWARTRFPNCGPVEHRWSGQIMEPTDGVAFIGHNPADEPNVYVATGDSGNGLTHGCIAGILIRDLIIGHANPWAELYSPGRINFKATPDFVSENLNVASQFADYVTAGDIDAVAELQPGMGAILRDGTSKIAAYRDERGLVHQFSAVCPHLKCIVHWNTAERTWDCPCHGSRFDALGCVITGPALSNLQPAKVRSTAP